MENILMELKAQNKLICLYLNTDEENECTGYLTEVRDDYFLLRKIDDDGFANGYILGMVSNIYSIETDHKFFKRVELLYQLKEESHFPLRIQENNDLLEDVIDLCEKERLVASYYIKDKDDYIVGFVKRREHLVEIQELDQYGEASCVSYRKIEDIVCMTIEGIYEQSRHIMFDHYRIQE